MIERLPAASYWSGFLAPVGTASYNALAAQGLASLLVVVHMPPASARSVVDAKCDPAGRTWLQDMVQPDVQRQLLSRGGASLVLSLLAAHAPLAAHRALQLLGVLTCASGVFHFEDWCLMTTCLRVAAGVQPGCWSSRQSRL